MKRALAITFAVVLSHAWPNAQTAARKPLAIGDYTKWRSISGQEISGDGQWVTYVLQLTNVPLAETKPAQHLVNLDTNEDIEFANATSGTFSSDSKWLAYSVDPNPGRGNRGRGGTVAERGNTAAPADDEMTRRIGCGRSDRRTGEPDQRCNRDSDK